MSLYITSLNSGSNGNCYYIGNGEEAILVDAGISCRETEKRMKRLSLRMDSLKAIFISHEHTDHINGVVVLSKKYNLPVYITEATEQFSNLKLDKSLVKRFKANEPLAIGKLTVIAFRKEHDAGDPHSFVVSSASVNVGVITDIGMACKKVIHHFKQCHAAFLEANYDEEMLQNGSYPVHLKRRISEGKGHLSNIQALDLFIKHRPPFMTHLILSHLSKNNNDPGIVNTLFHQHAGSIRIVIASRYEETEVITIDGVDGIAGIVPQRIAVKPEQLSLF
jgi:phosphoribosyl 1,2-cyclic phosphodiesterase